MNCAGIIKPFLCAALIHLYRLVFEPKYRSYCWLVTRYGRTPRFQQRIIKLHDLNLTVPDVASFLSAYREIFVEEIYAFNADSSAPFILDCGANIGLSILYYKQKFPRAQVVAYEADPQIFSILEHNVRSNGIDGVELHNLAVWSSETFVEFSVEGADAGRINTGDDANIIRVPTVSLSSLIRERSYEFVKIDIEGAELEALKDCDDYLANHKYFFVEFHSFKDKKQGLGELILPFERSGFRVHVHPPLTAKQPFLGIKGYLGMDMQLNLFFWRDKNEDA